MTPPQGLHGPLPDIDANAAAPLFMPLEGWDYALVKYRTSGEWFDFGTLLGPVARIRKEAVRLGAEEVPA